MPVGQDDRVCSPVMKRGKSFLKIRGPVFVDKKRPILAWCTLTCRFLAEVVLDRVRGRVESKKVLGFGQTEESADIVLGIPDRVWAFPLRVQIVFDQTVQRG